MVSISSSECSQRSCWISRPISRELSRRQWSSYRMLRISKTLSWKSSFLDPLTLRFAHVLLAGPTVCGMVAPAVPATIVRIEARLAGLSGPIVAVSRSQSSMRHTPNAKCLLLRGCDLGGVFFECQRHCCFAGVLFACWCDDGGVLECWLAV